LLGWQRIELLALTRPGHVHKPADHRLEIAVARASTRIRSIGLHVAVLAVDALGHANKLACCEDIRSIDKT
jgi:mRNA-degrading endonuclease toxin of MazEF toxin-antitoxin module